MDRWGNDAMFGIGFTELIIIVIATLVVLGPERLPELAGKLGTTVRDLRRMYANLRAELGSDFDDIEQGIRDLRSLDPRQQLRDYGRDLLNDVTRDAPELKQLAAAPKLDVERIGRSVLRDELLDKPLADKTAAQAVPANTANTSGVEDELLESLITNNDGQPSAQAASNGHRAVAKVYDSIPSASSNGRSGAARDKNATRELKLPE